MVPLCTPSYRCLTTLEKQLATQSNWSLQPSHYVILDNGKNFSTHDLTTEESIEPHLDKSHIYVKPPQNLGVSRSWNWFLKNLMREHEFIIIHGDDVTFQDDTFETICHYAAKYHEQHPIIIGFDGQWNVFAQANYTLDEIGYYDEKFFPAYFEDNDYYYRMRLAGYQYLVSQDIKFDHIGSGSLKAFNGQEKAKHHEQFRKNKNYYIKKWGGSPGKETKTLS